MFLSEVVFYLNSPQGAPFWQRSRAVGARAAGIGFRVQGLGFKVQGSGCRCDRERSGLTSRVTYISPWGILVFHPGVKSEFTLGFSRVFFLFLF